MFLSPVVCWFVALLLLLAPAVNLIWRGGTGYCFFALLALALFTAASTRRPAGYFAALKCYPWYVAGMSAFLVAIAIQQAIYGWWLPRQFDAISRFALAIPVFLLLRQLPSRYFRAIGWGCAAGALVIGAIALVQRPSGGWTNMNRLNNDYTNAIPFGDTSLLLAFLSIFTLGWDEHCKKASLALKLAALVAGGFASYSSGTRGGWIAAPVFLCMLGVQYGVFATRKRIVLATLTAAICVGGLLATPRIQQRISDCVSDLTLFSHGNTDSSTGIRLELWKGATRLFVTHPVYGIGKGKLEDSYGVLADQNYLPRQFVNERAHSDFFSTLAESGSIGVLCLLTFYYGSAVYFWRKRRAADAFVRTAAWSGLAVAFSTMIFGLTIDVLVPVMVTTLIAVLVAALLAAIDAREREINEKAAKRPASGNEVAIEHLSNARIPDQPG
ncbi:O-antigen ligase [Paraburkholderia bannensis]|uniref:O-antigen ligase n=1 Tax=Paraburkholderia bannensis TaxID=765414 RepID=A0A7W9TZF1_9BURK|nr:MULTISPECIES: O-antigen ligase family protein [Paraburkholderia]MBB3259206.1 O-antigen ligase [Paraburkholderia sp. WP4_3_2]MBB6104221.1 O-antigen ligase [Paraburkholderia bannensis]